MTWDFRTLKGPDRVARFIESSKGSGIIDVSLNKSVPHKVPKSAHFGIIDVVQAFLKVETSNGWGGGFVRLASDIDDGGIWKALTLFTTLKELKKHVEKVCTRRPTGIDRNLDIEGRNWKDRLMSIAHYLSLFPLAIVPVLQQLDGRPAKPSLRMPQI